MWSIINYSGVNCWPNSVIDEPYVNDKITGGNIHNAISAKVAQVIFTQFDVK